MSGPCFAHFQMNCQICFPTATNGNGMKTSPQPASTTPSPTAIPGPALRSTGSGGVAASTENSTVKTIVTTDQSSTPDVPATSTGAPSADDEKKRKRLAVEFRPLKRKKNAIIDCVVAQQILRRDLGLKNKFFKSGDVLAWALEPDDPAFRYIQDYVASGQEHGYGLRVRSILRIIPKAKSLENADIDFKDDPNTKDKLRIMLWHGTRKNSVASILENGLKLDWARGGMFGRGIYFADRVSKSCQYCRVYFPNKDMFLFLCDVLVGRIYESKDAICGIRSPPATKIGSGLFDWRTSKNDSVKGVGRNIPDEQGNKVLDGSIWPLGKTVQQPEDNDDRSWFWGTAGTGYSLNYNEYIVYNENQVQPKYLVKLEFMSKPFYEKFG